MSDQPTWTSDTFVTFLFSESGSTRPMIPLCQFSFKNRGLGFIRFCVLWRFRLSKPELTLSSFCIFLHIFSLGNVTSPVYIVCGGYSLTFGTKSKSSRACSDVCETPTGTKSKSTARGRIETPLKRSAFRYFELS